MANVALKLRRDTLSHLAFNGVNVNQETRVASIPPSLHIFINLLLGEHLHHDDSEESSIEEHPPKQLGLGFT